MTGSFSEVLNVVSGNTSYTGTVEHLQGDCKLNNLNINDCTGRIEAGVINSNTRIVKGDYYVFSGVGSIATNSLQVRSLNGKIFTSKFSLNFSPGQTKASFAYPATRPDILNGSVLYLQGFDAPVGDTFTKSLFNVNDGAGNPVAYKIYTVELPAPETGQVTYNVTLP
jgi:hypothetical protein